MKLLGTYLDPLLAEEVSCSMKHISGVRGVVVGVGGVVIDLNDLKPGPQHGLRAVKELANAETGEDFQTEVG